MNTNSPTLWRDTSNITQALRDDHDAEMLLLKIRQRREVIAALERDITAHTSLASSIALFANHKKYQAQVEALGREVNQAMGVLKTHEDAVNHDYREAGTVINNQRLEGFLCAVEEKQAKTMAFFEVLLADEYENWGKEISTDMALLKKTN